MNKKSDNLEALRTTAEAQLAHSPKPKPAGELLHELQLQQTELEMQNEELRRVQLALEESRDRYVDLYELAPVGYLTITREGTISEINLTGARLLGVERKKLLRRCFGSFVAREQHDRWNRLFADTLQQSEANSCELTLRKSDGEYLKAHLDCQCLETIDGSKVVRIALADITRQIRAEDSLHEWQHFAEHASWGMAIADVQNQTIRLVNPAFARMHGYTVEEMPGMKSIDLFAQASRAGYAEYFKSLLDTGYHAFECMRLRKDGSAFYAVVDASVAKSFDGKANYIISVKDFTEHKQEEEKLRESEMMFSVIFSKATFALALSQLPNGDFVDVNEAWLQLFGYTKEEVVGKTPLELGINMNFASQASIIAELQQQGSVRNVESTLMTKHGDARILLVNVDMIDMGGQKYALTTLKDITERKIAEQHMRELTAHLLTIREEEKANIAREVHDDLGGTLTALKMEAYWLAEELSAGRESESLLKHVELISHLTENAVNVTRRVITGLRPTVLDDLGLLAALEWQAGQFHNHTGIACRVNSIEDKAKLDKHYSIALFRIFQEALTNVARHSGATRVEVEFHSSNEEVMLSVSDDGRGLPEGHNVSPTSYGVRGMRERVEQLGGKIKFDSPPGGGFNVTVTLPLPAEINRENKA